MKIFRHVCKYKYINGIINHKSYKWNNNNIVAILYIYIFLKEKIIYPKNSFRSKKKNRKLNGKKFRKISLSYSKKRNYRKEE